MRRQQQRSPPTTVRSPTAPPDSLASFRSYDALINPSRPVKSSPLGSSTIAGLPLELLDRLKAFPLFQTAPESFLQGIGKSLRPSVYQPNQEIICEGDEAKAMYWLVRGTLRVTSRDGESTYAELRPGSFFGEIGIFMNIPRTASIAASSRSLVVRLNKEDLQKELPKYPAVERAIREEALERLAILERKKSERLRSGKSLNGRLTTTLARKRSRGQEGPGDIEMAEAGSLAYGEIFTHKKRKSPSSGLVDLAGAAASSAVGQTTMTVRQLLKELPLFSGLPNDILHFLGINAIPESFPPFTEILTQGSTGRDVYFIVRGEVEVLAMIADDPSRPDSPPHHRDRRSPVDSVQGSRHSVRARLKAGQYFGEVTSLALAPARTATVRSVTAVECLRISGSTLDDLWARCGPDLRQQVETEARRRLKNAKANDGDVVMADAHMDEPISPARDYPAKTTVALDETQTTEISTPILQLEPIDPDPFFSAELDNVRSRSRRSSLAPPIPSDGSTAASLEPTKRSSSPPSIRLLAPSPLKPRGLPGTSPASPLRLSPTLARRPSWARTASNASRSGFPDPILTRIFSHMDLLELMHCRLVSLHWCRLINTSPDLVHTLDLSKHNRRVTDDTLANVIVPFVGSRPRVVDLSNCFHVTDEGFRRLADACGKGVRVWRMKSVWDVSAPAILSLVEKAKDLEEIDLSNCRKVGDSLLSRVIGWVVPENAAIHHPTATPSQNSRRPGMKRGQAHVANTLEQSDSPPGTVIGASKLKRLTLSYCKHIQDRSMQHLGMHAADRLEVLDLTRCTSISDAGFQSWAMRDFRHLRKLVLADCTYLSDQAIVGVVGGCHNLLELDLSFCCALSDTSTEVLALGLPQLQSLNMAFCGSAISDNSMHRIGLHLLELRYLSVRGCVRVTGNSVESIVEGCRHLERFDVSQCKNLQRWLYDGGVERVNHAVGEERNIVFQTVADGSWRVGAR